MDLLLRCRCGELQGHVATARSTTRVICYCRDCQAYARHLKAPGVLDADGGTDIVASLPGQVHLARGQERLACLSLSPRGLLRWYADCCDTPIANTPRNPRVAYAGVVHTAFDGSPSTLDAAFGPPRMAVNTGSALRPVAARPAANLVGGVGLAATLLGARLSGAYRRNPFFDAGLNAPVRVPRVLTPTERQRAAADA